MQNDGSLTTSDKDKANVLNSFFTSVFTREDMTIMPEQPEQHPVKKMYSIVFTLCDVANKLERLNPNKSPGPDGMHPKVLRELSTTLAEPLYAIFTQFINTGKLPKDWKMGHVSLIYCDTWQYIEGQQKPGKNLQASEPHFCSLQDHGVTDQRQVYGPSDKP